MAVGRPTMGRECEQCRARLSEYLDGELTEREQVAVEAHLGECADCRRELALLGQTVRTVVDLPARVPRSGFAERVVQLVRAGTSAPERRPVVVLWRRLLPVAAMLTLVVGLIFTVQRGGLVEEGIEGRQVAMAPPPTAAADGMARPVSLEEPALSTPAEDAMSLPGFALGRVGGPEMAGAEPTSRRGMIDTAAEAPATAAIAGRRSAGVPLARPEEAAGERVEARLEAAPPALSWEGFRESDEGLIRADAEAPELVFTQMMPKGSARVRGPAQQIFTLTAEDPTDLMRRAVAVANINGVAATLSFREVGADGGVDVHLIVPVSQYDALLSGLVRLAPPENQALANTLVAKGEFFRIALKNYDAYRGSQVRARRARAAEEKEAAGRDLAQAGAAGERAKGEALPSGMPAARAAAAAAAADRMAELEKTRVARQYGGGAGQREEAINLIVRVTRQSRRPQDQ